MLVLPRTPNQVHPMWKKMGMLVVHLSGSLQKAKHCQEMLLKSYQLCGEWEQEKGTKVKFCRERYTDPIQATTEMGIEFLTEYSKTEVGYSSFNSARSVLSSIIKPLCNVPFGKSPLVCRLLKVVFNIRPALPRYVATCDVIKVFTFIKSKPTITNCDLKTLSHRLIIILCLTTGQRDQTIKCFNLDCIKICSDKVVLFVPETLKTTRPGHHLPPIELKTFKESELCVIAHLKQYIKMTALFRNTGTKQLLLSFVQPHKPITNTTLSRWCVPIMKESGIIVNIFGSHANRSASTSKCKISGLSFKEIAKSAGWSNENTFAQFYDKPIQEDFSSYLFR